MQVIDQEMQLIFQKNASYRPKNLSHLPNLQVVNQEMQFVDQEMQFIFQKNASYRTKKFKSSSKSTTCQPRNETPKKCKPSNKKFKSSSKSTSRQPGNASPKKASHRPKHLSHRPNM